MKVPPFVRKSSGGLRRRSFIMKRASQEKSSMISACSSSDGTDPVIPFDHYTERPQDQYTVPPPPSEVSMSSDSSSGYSADGHEVPIDWATAIVATDSGMVVDWGTAKVVDSSDVYDDSGVVPIKKSRSRSFQKKVVEGSLLVQDSDVSGVVPIIKKRSRSFRKKLFRDKPRAYKTNKKLDFSLIDSPLKSPMPVHLTYDSSVASESTYGYSQPVDYEKDDSAPASALSIKSIKRLAFSSTKQHDEGAFPSSSTKYLAVEEKDDVSEGENTRVSTKSVKSNFSIPLSYFIKKNPSWGASATTEAVSDAGSEAESNIAVLQQTHWDKEIRRWEASATTEAVSDAGSEAASNIAVLQQTHWDKEIRSRSRGSMTWVPTEEERYQISQGFAYGEDEDEDEAKEEEEDEDASSESGTTGVTTEVTRDTGVSESTNDTASAHTGYYSVTDSGASSEYSYVTGTTETSMFSLEVDDSSESTQGSRKRRRKAAARRRSRQKLMNKSEKNLLVEVFADLKLLVEDIADDQEGFRGCLGCGQQV